MLPKIKIYFSEGFEDIIEKIYNENDKEEINKKYLKILFDILSININILNITESGNTKLERIKYRAHFYTSIAFIYYAIFY